MTVTVWLNIADRLITPMEQGERLFHDDVRSSVRDQTSLSTNALGRRTQERTEGRERESASLRGCYLPIGVLIRRVNIYGIDLRRKVTSDIFDSHNDVSISLRCFVVNSSYLSRDMYISNRETVNF